MNPAYVPSLAPDGTERLKIPRADEQRQCEVAVRLAFTPAKPVIFEAVSPP